MTKARIYGTTYVSSTIKDAGVLGFNLLRRGALLVSGDEEPFSRYRESSILRIFWYVEEEGEDLGSV